MGSLPQNLRQLVHSAALRCTSTFLLLGLAYGVLAQASTITTVVVSPQDRAALDTVPLAPSLSTFAGAELDLDSLLGRPATLRDTLPQNDSLALADSLAPKPLPPYRLSPDALDDAVDYTAVDSMHYSVADQTIRLYRKTEVKYADLTLGAGTMEIDYGNKLVRAKPRVDSVGVEVEDPSFVQGAQAFEAGEIKYNYDTRKGIIYDTRTTQGDLFVTGGRTKIVAADPSDPSRTDNVIYNSSALISTCDLEHKHYGIRSSKQKVIPGKQVIVGPSNVELGGVPTPLWLPFGFFPIGTSERSGLIFPSDYTYTAVSGFGFEGIGWYFPWNDKLHTSLTTDLFLKGTLRVDLTNNYSVKYRYTGSLFVNGSRNRAESLEGLETYQNSMNIVWNHRQDPKAHPYRTLGASVNFQTNNNTRRNNAGAYFQTSNQSSSRINYSVKFPEHPSWQLSAALQSSQNFNTREVNVNFPDLRFNTGQMYPFKAAGKNSRAWYRKTTFDYSASALGSVKTTDTTIFTQETLDRAVYGAQQRASLSAPINVLKYFRFSPQIRYAETYYFDQRSQFFAIDTTFARDTLQLDGQQVITIDTNFRSRLVDTLIDATGFATVARELSASVSLSTQIYGTARFRLGPLRGIRHILTPNVSTGFQPDYARRPFDYFRDAMDPLTRELRTYLRFPSQPFSPGSFPLEQSLNIAYSLGNRVETKIQGRADSVARNTTLLNNLSFGGSYSPTRDSLRWSPIRVSGAQLAFFDKVVRVNFGTTLSVYGQNEAGQLINQPLLQAGRFPFRIADFNYSVSAGLTLTQIREMIFGTARPLPKNSIFDLISRFNISYNFARDFNSARVAQPWATRTNTVNVSGPLPITEKWSIRSITIGYDFQSRRITYPTLSLGRDLHCWEMDFFWSPAFGGQYSFSIRVKPSSLGFLSIPYRRGSSR